MFTVLYLLTAAAQPVPWELQPRVVPWLLAAPPAPDARGRKLTYAEGAAAAKANGLPLVVWVGRPDGPAVPGVLAAYADKPLAPWWPEKGAVVSAWVGGEHVGVPLAGGVTADDVTAAVVKVRANPPKKP